MDRIINRLEQREGPSPGQVVFGFLHQKLARIKTLKYRGSASLVLFDYFPVVLGQFPIFSRFVTKLNRLATISGWTGTGHNATKEANP
jgi:hypothetical protein